MFDLVITNARLVIPRVGIVEADLGIIGEKISCICSNGLAGKGATTIDLKGLYVLPGVVDPHVHFGNTLPFLSDIDTETKAACAGGTTTIVTQLKAGMFDSSFPSYHNVFPEVSKKIEGILSVDYAFHFHLANQLHIDEVPEYATQYGVLSYKCHMGYKKREEVAGVSDSAAHMKKMSPGVDDHHIYCSLRSISKVPGALLTLHCEADDLIAGFTREAKEKQLNGLQAWNAARPPVSEEHAIVRAAAMARSLKAPLYVVHVSSRDGILAIERAKKNGVPILAETCPHYLSLTDETPGSFGKVAPPIRQADDVEALWDSIQRGYVDAIGTDHSAKPRDSKGSDIWEASLGFPGFETALPAMITEGLRRGVSLCKIAELCSYNTARIFNLYPKKGTIAVGSDADLVAVDVEAEKTVSREGLHTASQFSPWEGRKLKGWPVMTLLRGKVVFQEGSVVSSGRGVYVPRKYHSSNYND